MSILTACLNDEAYAAAQGFSRERLCELYRIYEFTDEAAYMPEDCAPAASIFNFVRSGLLTREEARRALLM